MDKANINISNFLSKYNSDNYSRFHTPGHKGNDLLFSFKNKIQNDITEINGADSLYQSKGIINKLESEISSLYNSSYSLISCGGSTLSIQTMISLVAKPYDSIIIARNCHISVINTIALLNINPIWLIPNYIDMDGVSGEICVNDVEKLIKKNQTKCNIKAVFITSPDYFGVIQDVEKISKICKKYDIDLIVDAAHGSSLNFDIKANRHPIHCGATMCCESLHKTMPALTPAALLHINSPKYTIREAKLKMSLFGSTSPSYLVMESINWCITYLKNQMKNISCPSNDFLKLKNEYDLLNNLIKQKQINLNITERVSKSGIQTAITHIVLDFSKYNINIEDIVNRSLKEMIMPEYTSTKVIVFLISTFNKKEDFYKLYKFIENISLTKKLDKPLQNDLQIQISNLKKIISPHQAIFSSSKYINILNSLGHVIAQPTISSPPGIPLIMPGEKITQFIINYFKNTGINKIKVVI